MFGDELYGLYEMHDVCLTTSQTADVCYKIIYSQCVTNDMHNITSGMNTVLSYASLLCQKMLDRCSKQDMLGTW